MAETAGLRVLLARGTSTLQRSMQVANVMMFVMCATISSTISRLSGMCQDTIHGPDAPASRAAPHDDFHEPPAPLITPCLSLRWLSCAVTMISTYALIATSHREIYQNPFLTFGFSPFPRSGDHARQRYCNMHVIYTGTDGRRNASYKMKKYPPTIKTYLFGHSDVFPRRGSAHPHNSLSHSFVTLLRGSAHSQPRL